MLKCCWLVSNGWTEVGGRCHFSPLATHHGVRLLISSLWGQLSWGFTCLPAVAPALLHLETPKPQSGATRRRDEIGGDGHLWELFTKQHMVEGCCQKHHYNVIIAFVIFMVKLGKKKKKENISKSCWTAGVCLPKPLMENVGNRNCISLQHVLYLLD